MMCAMQYYVPRLRSYTWRKTRCYLDAKVRLLEEKNFRKSIRFSDKMPKEFLVESLPTTYSVATPLRIVIERSIESDRCRE